TQSPMVRARRGLGRTFQRMELYDTLTVKQNVALGREAVQAGRGPLWHVLAPRRERLEAEAAAGDALHRCGLQDVADQVVGKLPTGARRLVELARALAGGYRLLLLDEPSSGLDAAETRRFGQILSQE